MRYFLIAPLSLLLCFGCKSYSKTDYSSSDSDSGKAVRLAVGYAKGKKQFLSYCTPCHTPLERRITDRISFEGIFDRLPGNGEEYFKKFVWNSRALKDSGEHYAMALAKDYNTDYDHHFRDSLTYTDINDLISYIKIAADPHGRAVVN